MKYLHNQHLLWAGGIIIIIIILKHFSFCFVKFGIDINFRRVPTFYIIKLFYKFLWNDWMWERELFMGSHVDFSVLNQLSSTRPTRWTHWSIWRPWRPWPAGWRPESTSAKLTSWWSPVLMCPQNIDRQTDGQRTDSLEANIHLWVNSTPWELVSLADSLLWMESFNLIFWWNKRMDRWMVNNLRNTLLTDGWLWYELNTTAQKEK